MREADLKRFTSVHLLQKHKKLTEANIKSGDVNGAAPRGCRLLLPLQAKPAAFLILPDAGQTEQGAWSRFVPPNVAHRRLPSGSTRLTRALTCFSLTGHLGFGGSICFQSAENGGWSLESKASPVTRIEAVV